MDPLYGFAGVVLLAVGFALIGLGGRLTGRRPHHFRPVTNTERAVVLPGAFALIGGIFLIGFAIVAANSGSGGSSPM